MKEALQSLLNQALPAYQQHRSLSPQQTRVCQHIQSCHTEVLGECQDHCEHCSHEQIFYLSCRDRHCPQCQYHACQTWAKKQQQAVIPIPYYHVVFTLPHELNGWVQLHPELIYQIVFQTVWQTIDRFAKDRRRLGGKIGMTAVLHTWAQNLSRHVHLHCLIPGGVLDERHQFKQSKGNYLFPNRALSRVYRGTLVSALRQVATTGQLHRVTRPGEIDETLDKLMSKDWVVYAKDCIGHTETVINYLSRYTRRIAIDDRRIESIKDGKVRFWIKDRENKTQALLQLSHNEFIRRYLQHVLPKGFMRVRHYGYLANCVREKRLTQIRQCLELEELTEKAEVENEKPQPAVTTRICPKCHVGHLIRSIRLPRPRREGG